MRNFFYNYKYDYDLDEFVKDGLRMDIFIPVAVLVILAAFAFFI